jgi:hypothetical protein
MSIKSLYPDTRPSLNLDFANTKVLDPRITFARASTATYYDGKTVSKAEENLSLYSQQFNAWSNLSITLTADTDIAPDGTQTADKLVPNGTNTRHISYLATNATINNLPYTYSAYFKAAGYNFAQLGLFLNSSGCDAYIIIDLTNGTVTQSAGNTGVRGTFTYSVQSVGNGWYRGVITCGNVTGMSWAQGIILAASNSGTPSLAAAGSPTFSGDGTSGILIWGAQLEQRSSVTAYTPTTNQHITRYAPTLLTAPTNSPRFDHNPITGESLGLLIEEQRTNLITYSSNFANGSWDKNYVGGNYKSTVESNAAVAPDGTLTASKIYRTPGQGSGGIGLIKFDTGGSAGQSYSTSVYFKYSGYSTNSRYVTLVSSDASSGNNETQFDILTGTIVSNGSANTSSITHVGNGWYRCTVSANTLTAYRYVWFKNDLSLNEGSGFLIWGAQFESGPFPTSYTPTTGSQVTRSADSASMTGTNFSSWYTEGEGTLYAEQIVGNIDAARSNQTAALLYLDTSNLIGIGQAAGWAGTSGRLANMWIHLNSSPQMINGTANFLNVGDTLKSAGAYTFNDAAFSGNTQPLLTDNTVIVPTGLNQLLIGNGYPGYYSNGWIKKISYYPKRLPNSQLQALTQP